jgi:hypothetical protein
MHSGEDPQQGESTEKERLWEERKDERLFIQHMT